MDTIKLNHGTVKMIAHRGASSLETENTLASFIAAGNRSYFGIETDVHVTKDGKFLLFHDDSTGRLTAEDRRMEETESDALRALQLTDLGEPSHRPDLRMPTLSEYIAICKKYEKKAVLELKNRIAPNKIAEMAEEIKNADFLNKTIFISFYIENLTDLKEMYPEVHAQFLTTNPIDEKMISTLLQYHLDIDAKHTLLTKELVCTLHNKGIVVNCWTVDDVDIGEALINMGVDMITTNCLE